MLAVSPTWIARAVLGIGFLASASAQTDAPRAQCFPARGPIVIDGDLSDWDEILTNPTQTTLDGDGSIVPCPFSTDLDCIVQSSVSE